MGPPLTCSRHVSDAHSAPGKQLPGSAALSGGLRGGCVGGRRHRPVEPSSQPAPAGFPAHQSGMVACDQRKLYRLSVKGHTRDGGELLSMSLRADAWLAAFRHAPRRRGARHFVMFRLLRAADARRALGRTARRLCCAEPKCNVWAVHPAHAGFARLCCGLGRSIGLERSGQAPGGGSGGACALEAMAGRRIRHARRQRS